MMTAEEMLDFTTGNQKTGFYVNCDEADRAEMQRLVDKFITGPIEDTGNGKLRAQLLPPGYNPYIAVEIAKDQLAL
jgi:hypothetical protein